jgi:hypothetical protein
MQQSTGSMGHSKHRKCPFHKQTARSPRIQLEMCALLNKMREVKRPPTEWYSSVQKAFEAARNGK